MNAQQQQKGNEWMRTVGTLASAPGLVAILWEPKGEGTTQDPGGGSCEALHLTKYSTACRRELLLSKAGKTVT